MVKIKLLGVERSEKHHFYLFFKTQEFFPFMRNLLKDLGFDISTYESFGRPTDKKYGEPIQDQEEEIKKYTDEKFKFQNDEYFIEVIFGKNKVFLMIHTESDRQSKLIDILNKYCKFQKVPYKKKPSKLISHISSK